MSGSSYALCYSSANTDIFKLPSVIAQIKLKVPDISLPTFMNEIVEAVSLSLAGVSGVSN